MHILIIIVTYNPAEWLDKCLSSLYESNVKLDIIVIDNGSTDGSIEVLKNNHPNISLILNSENKGFGSANNQGLSIALKENADFAFLLNQDAWIETDTIGKLIKESIKNKGYGILSPIHLNGKGDTFERDFSSYAGPESCLYFSDLAINNKVQSVYEVPFINAAAWLITKECMQIVGGFSPSFFHYGEDNNYCERVNYHNFKIGFVPNAFIYHDRNLSSDNPFFSNYKKWYLRKMTIELSHPDCSSNINFYSFVIRDILKHVLSFRVSKALTLIKIIFTTPLKEIEQNRNITKVKGSSFL